MCDLAARIERDVELSMTRGWVLCETGQFYPFHLLGHLPLVRLSQGFAFRFDNLSLIGGTETMYDRFDLIPVYIDIYKEKPNAHVTPLRRAII